MLCSQCGQELPKDSKLCTACGENSIAEETLSENAVTAKETTVPKKIRLTLRTLAEGFGIIALVCLLLPFMNFVYEDGTDGVSGLSLMTLTGSMSDLTDVSRNYWIILSTVCMVLCLVVLFTSGKTVVSLITSIASVLCLNLFNFSMESFYFDSDTLSLLQLFGLDIAKGIGFYFAFVTTIATVLLSLLLMMDDKQEEPEASLHPMPMQNDEESLTENIE